jgi:hypothetical protein
MRAEIPTSKWAQPASMWARRAARIGIPRARAKPEEGEEMLCVEGDRAICVCSGVVDPRVRQGALPYCARKSIDIWAFEQTWSDRRHHEWIFYYGLSRKVYPRMTSVILPVTVDMKELTPIG